METLKWKLTQFVLPSVRSYPTYEEWKQIKRYFLSFTILCSYPTYEEWKPIVMVWGVQLIICSYPTYEEWKPLIEEIRKAIQPKVLILPMRNGNYLI